LPPEASNAILESSAESVPASARGHLAALYGLEDGYIEAAIGQLPPGTSAALLACGALDAADEDFAPVLTAFGRELLRHLADGHAGSVAVPDASTLWERYERLSELRSAETDLPVLAVGGALLNDVPVADRADAEVRTVEALTDEAIATALRRHDGVLGVEGAGELLVEPTPVGLQVSAVSDRAQEWQLITADGENVGSDPTPLPVKDTADIGQLARSLLGIRRRAR
jgi:hypothetical protein